MSVFQLRDYQQEASDAACTFIKDRSSSVNGILILPTGCHEKGYPILMYDGTTKPVEDIKVGDLLMGDDNTSRKVLSLHRGRDMMFQVVPTKGVPFVVNGGHILHLHKTSEGKDYPSCKQRFDEISVNEYIEKSNYYKHLHKLHKASVVDFHNDVELPIEPYFIGLLLGDGNTSNNSISITTMESEVKDYLYDFAYRNGYTIRDSVKPDNLAHSYFIKGYGDRSHKWFSKSSLRLELECLGLFGKNAESKFIPQLYKTASIEDRFKLLAGLVDTDGYLNNNCIEYVSKSETLLHDIEFVCQSLGLSCSFNKPKLVNGELYFRCIIYGDIDKIPTKVARRKGATRKQKKSNLVTGFKVYPVGEDDYYGFTLDGNHLYLDGQFFVHHNSGKSLVIADIISKFPNDKILVFQPNKEILEQNYKKLLSYDVLDCSIFSASLNRKDISRVTFATIGSVDKHKNPEEFDSFRIILIDECHLVNSNEGMYRKFIKRKARKVLGLTATPYRLESANQRAILRLITNTQSRIFGKILYYCPIQRLLQCGYLAKLKYFDMQKLDTRMIKLNSTGRDYDEESLKKAYIEQEFGTSVRDMVVRLLHPKSGVPRKGILVFTQFVEESQLLKDSVEGVEIVTGETPKKERERIIDDFRSGKIKVVTNVGVLTTGFDYPELDTILLARPTMSLGLYYQMVGRAIRPFPNKDGWVVDICGNIKRFGRVDDLQLGIDSRTNKPEFFGMAVRRGSTMPRVVQLTNVSL